MHCILKRPIIIQNIEDEEGKETKLPLYRLYFLLKKNRYYSL